LVGLAWWMGVVAGLRSMTAPAAVSWAVSWGGLPVHHPWLVILGRPFSRWVVTVLAAAELVADQLPQTPSRTHPAAVVLRVLVGAGVGAALGGAGHHSVGGSLAGMAGAVAGAFGGHAARTWLATRVGRDRPAALLEDAVAISSALLILRAAARPEADWAPSRNT
jgi:uncharacterized membrane protein